jgi:hypothetical protein
MKYTIFVDFPLAFYKRFSYITFINERQTGAALMKNGTRQIVKDHAAKILEALEGKGLDGVHNINSSKADTAEENIALMRVLNDLHIELISDLAGETVDMTGCGSMAEMTDWKDNLQAEIDERFLTDMEKAAEEMGSYSDPYAEHRLTTQDYGLEAAE